MIYFLLRVKPIFVQFIEYTKIYLYSYHTFPWRCAFLVLFFDAIKHIGTEAGGVKLSLNALSIDNLL